MNTTQNELSDSAAHNAEPLTDRQRKIMDAIQQCLKEHGFPPSFREIGEAVGLRSPSSVNINYEHSK